MLINEVESVVGLSKKSIRYYEEEGLIKPKRSHNDYRYYSEEDVKNLKNIKFLRELGVPIQEIKALKKGTLSLYECMQDRIHKIEEESNNYMKIKSMCEDIALKNTTLEDLNIENHVKNMNILNKKGFTMREVKTDKKKKIQGAALSSILFGLFFIFMAGVITYFQITQEEKMPWFLFIFMIGILLIPVIGIVINLITRVKEIKGGEEDEASKY